MNNLDYLDKTINYLEEIAGKEELNVLTIGHNAEILAHVMNDAVLFGQFIGASHRTTALALYTFFMFDLNKKEARH